MKPVWKPLESGCSSDEVFFAWTSFFGERACERVRLQCLGNPFQNRSRPLLFGDWPPRKKYPSIIHAQGYPKQRLPRGRDVTGEHDYKSAVFG